MDADRRPASSGDRTGRPSIDRVARHD